MPTKTTTPKTGAKTAAKASPARKLTKPKLVHSEAAPLAVAESDGAPAAKAAGTALRLKDLVEAVVAATGGKKKGVKEIVEATLTQMGDALERGETLLLPAFGRARVAKPGVDGGPMTLKLRRGEGGKGKGKAGAADMEDDTDTLADESDQG